MFQVTNGIITITVTKGAFKSFYKDIGFHPVDGVGGENDIDRVTVHPEEEIPASRDSSMREIEDTETDTGDGEDDEEIDLSEIPLGEMNFDQLSDYADQLELDHDGVRSKKELRMMIREYLKR